MQRFYDTVGSGKSKARLRTGPLRTVGTQRPYGTTVVSTVQGVIAWVDIKNRLIVKLSNRDQFPYITDLSLTYKPDQLKDEYSLQLSPWFAAIYFHCSLPAYMSTSLCAES